jgi:hypothetical protein
MGLGLDCDAFFEGTEQLTIQAQIAVIDQMSILALYAQTQLPCREMCCHARTYWAELSLQAPIVQSNRARRYLNPER